MPEKGDVLDAFAGDMVDPAMGPVSVTRVDENPERLPGEVELKKKKKNKKLEI